MDILPLIIMTIHLETPPPPPPDNDSASEYSAMQAFPQEKISHYSTACILQHPLRDHHVQNVSVLTSYFTRNYNNMQTKWRINPIEHSNNDMVSQREWEKGKDMGKETGRAEKGEDMFKYNR